jgi:hypothetical protein
VSSSRVVPLVRLPRRKRERRLPRVGAGDQPEGERILLRARLRRRSRHRPGRPTSVPCTGSLASHRYTVERCHRRRGGRALRVRTRATRSIARSRNSSRDAMIGFPAIVRAAARSSRHHQEGRLLRAWWRVVDHWHYCSESPRG